MKSKKVKRETWRTTDEEERTKRQERAKVEPMKVRSVDAPDGFGLYEVSHPAADRRTATYHVEIRSLEAPVNTCDCPDFAKSGLGTCKHIERALKTAARKCGSRQLDMGDLLSKGGFVAEAQGAYRKAVALAAAVACYARGSGELDAAINPVTMEDLVRVREELLLSPEDTLILQLAVQGLDLPNASVSAREFCQARR